MTKGLAILTTTFGARMSRLTVAQQTELKTLLDKLL
jgi:hypothetical protein